MAGRAARRPDPAALARRTRVARAAFAWAPPVVLLLPGLLLAREAPLPETQLRDALLATWAWVALGRAPARAPRAARVLAACALVAAAGFVFHPVRATLAGGAGTSWFALAAAILVGAAFGAGAAARDRAVRGLGVAAVVAGAWVLLDRALGRPPVGPFGRTGATGPAMAALAFFAPFALGAAARPAARIALACVPAAALAVGGSRTGALAAALAACLFLALRARTVVVRWTSVAVGVALAGAVAAAVAVPSLPLPGSRETVEVRLGLARASARLVAEAPLVGHGAGAFGAEVLRVRDPAEALRSAGRRPLAAHDDALHAAVEGGLLAGLAVLALAIGATVLAVRRARTASDASERVTLSACAAALAAIALASLAEDPFLEAPTVLVFGVAAGLAAARGRGGAREGDLDRPLHPAVIGALRSVLVLAALVHGLVAAADLRFARGAWAPADAIRAAAAAGDPTVAREADPALAAFPWHRDASYAIAARLARAGAYGAAREQYRRVLEIDPGATEARLDVAETYRREDRVEDARSALEAAGRADPTRFDVPHRLGHLLVGPEAPPSRARRLDDAVGALRLYGEAAALARAPGRFETEVAYARVYRRRGMLEDAGAALRAAERLGGRRSEVLLESARLAEAEGASPAATLGILAAALTLGPEWAADVRAEATRDLASGEAREREALEAARTSLRPDFTAARADFDAAALRLGALVVSGVEDAAALRTEAKALAAAGRHRRALALYRALLSDPFGQEDPDLAFDAARSAQRVDPERAATYGARGRALLAVRELREGDLAAAERDFRAAAEKDPTLAAAHYGLARVLARRGDRDGARAALGRARGLAPEALDRARSDPDLAPLLDGSPQAPPADPARDGAPK